VILDIGRTTRTRLRHIGSDPCLLSSLRFPVRVPDKTAPQNP